MAQRRAFAPRRHWKGSAQTARHCSGDAWHWGFKHRGLGQLATSKYREAVDTARNNAVLSGGVIVDNTYHRLNTFRRVGYAAEPKGRDGGHNLESDLTTSHAPVSHTRSGLPRTHKLHHGIQPRPSPNE
jgi:hypothetical protein